VVSRDRFLSIASGGKRRLRALLLAVAAVACPACADRSYAPAATPRVDELRLWLGIPTVILLVIWLAVLVWAVMVSFRERGPWIGQLVQAGLGLVLGIVLPFTISGQLIDWIGTNLVGWGVVGMVVFGLSSAAYGLNGGAGSPLPLLIVFGYLYPRPEVLPLAIVPALLTQTGMLVYTLRQLLR
jgi:hypothetical protein